jgi:DNA-binding response OmpR family regulator
MQKAKKTRILWTDDEIDLLAPHIMFLRGKGYDVTTASNGIDTVELVGREQFDLIFLDEHMPGLSGIETLTRIRHLNNMVPVVMVTKSEEENTMEMAIGAKINDYLIKPVKPNQILLSIKKNLEVRDIISRETTTAYRSEFKKLGDEIDTASSYTEWGEVYRKLVFWELELERLKDPAMYEILSLQKAEAGKGFGKFVRNNYASWFGKEADKPLLSQNVIREKVVPLIDAGNKVILILIDNLRLDHWRVLYPVIHEYFVPETDGQYYSILPTSTQYARNAFFSGLMPLDINELYPELWVEEDEEKGKNMSEEELLGLQMKRLGRNIKISYDKISQIKTGKKMTDNQGSILANDLTVIVYNFIDMLAHANTDEEMIRELAADDPAYRSLLVSWFQHSQLLDFIKMLSSKNVKLVITTDHGSVRVNNPVKIIGERKASVNLRYKMGRNLNYNPREVFEVKDPSAIRLPKSGITSAWIFATGNDYFVYQNNYNYFASYYRNTLQHGGISMEEMIVPFVILKPR